MQRICANQLRTTNKWIAKKKCNMTTETGSTTLLASVPGFSFMPYGGGAENMAKKKKSLVDFDHVGTVTCNGMQFCHTSYLGVK